VIFFTLALFLSGYALQQRTLKHLREAIKPKPKPAPSPLIFLPERFKHADRFNRDTTELEDGTVVVIEKTKLVRDGAGRRASGRSAVRSDDGDFAGEEEDAAELSERQRMQREKLMQEILSAYPKSTQPKDVEDEEVETIDEGAEPEPELISSAEDSEIDAQQVLPSTESEMEARPEEEEVLPPVIGPSEKPISKAERRRRIREDIQRLALADQPVYYQRRLW
jgi:hypothetical protein